MSGDQVLPVDSDPPPVCRYNTLPPNELAATLQHLASVGPLAVASDASRWQLYGSGVFTGCSYDQNIALNHAIQLVG